MIVQLPSAKLPSRWAHLASGGGGGRPIVDEFLAQLLLQLGLADPEIHALSTKIGLAEGQRSKIELTKAIYGYGEIDLSILMKMIG